MTALISSQSVQAKNAKGEIRMLRSELERYRSQEVEKRRASVDFGVECCLSESGYEEDPIAEPNGQSGPTSKLTPIPSTI